MREYELFPLFWIFVCGRGQKPAPARRKEERGKGYLGWGEVDDEVIYRMISSGQPVLCSHLHL